jgi:large subunit ribosomal protein L11
MQIKILADGGAMKPGPALSQKLGPAGIPINQVIAKINEATADFSGMKVPVELEVNVKTKTFEVKVFSPPVSELLKKEIGITKGSGIQSKLYSGNASIEQIIKVAKTKQQNLLCNDLKTSVKTVIGSCVSLGILVESKLAKDVEKEVNQGKYDKEIKNIITETPTEKKKQLDLSFQDIKAKQEFKIKQETKAKEEATAAAATATPAAPATAKPAATAEKKK